MKIKKLYIESNRNIQKLDLDLSSQQGLSVLIGNNGCGKSNILESVVAIFASLFDDRDRFKPKFKYTLEYIVDAHNVVISNIDNRIQIDDQQKNKEQLQQYLPKNLIACYSGETTRLEDEYFKPFRQRFVSNRLHNKHADLRLLFVNKDLWNVSLLTLFLHDDTYTDIHAFLKQTLNIQGIDNLRFELRHEANIQENEAKQLLNAIAPNGDKIVSISFADLKSKIQQVGFTPKEVFMAFYVGMYAGIFKKIDITVCSNTGSKFDANLLSEGEKKLLSIFTMLEVLGDENSLMLYDEPDSQIHISRKDSIKLLIEKYLNRQHLLSTHSPTLAKSFIESNQHLCCLKRNENGYIERIDNDKYELIADLTDGQWNMSEQNTFLASNKPMTLLVEGKTDKIHIERAFQCLKERFPSLDFDVFSMNSSEHIREVLIGLSCSEIVWKKKFVGIFDNDNAGQKDISNGFEKENCDDKIKHVKYKDGLPSNSFYAFLLPKPKDYKDDFTIENCYNASKYENALSRALDDKKGYFNGLSIETITKDLKNKAKIILAEDARSFSTNDFDGFIHIFEMLDKIREL